MRQSQSCLRQQAWSSRQRAEAVGRVQTICVLKCLYLIIFFILGQACLAPKEHLIVSSPYSQPSVYTSRACGLTSNVKYAAPGTARGTSSVRLNITWTWRQAAAPTRLSNSHGHVLFLQHPYNQTCSILTTRLACKDVHD